MDKLLNLNKIDIKIRSNNSLDNFNKILHKNFSHKGEQEPYLFLDTIMEEPLNHENYINQLNSQILPEESKAIITGTSKKKLPKNINLYEEINYIIVELENDNILCDDNIKNKSDVEDFPNDLSDEISTKIDNKHTNKYNNDIY